MEIVEILLLKGAEFTTDDVSNNKLLIGSYCMLNLIGHNNYVYQEAY